MDVIGDINDARQSIKDFQMYIVPCEPIVNRRIIDRSLARTDAMVDDSIPLVSQTVRMDFSQEDTVPIRVTPNTRSQYRSK